MTDELAKTIVESNYLSAHMMHVNRKFTEKI